MGSEAIWVPLAMAAIGGTASYVNNRNVAHKQDQNLAAQIRASGQKQQEADQRTAQLISQQAKDTDAQDKAKSLASYNQSLALKAPQATSIFKVPGAVSDAYAKAGSDAALGVTKYGADQADITSSMEAPMLQRQREHADMDSYKNDIGMIARRNAGDTFLANMRLRGIQGNPWLSLVSGVSGAAAGSMARSGNYGGSSLDAASGTPYMPANGDMYDYTMPVNPLLPDARKVYS